MNFEIKNRLQLSAVSVRSLCVLCICLAVTTTSAVAQSSEVTQTPLSEDHRQQYLQWRENTLAKTRKLMPNSDVTIGPITVLAGDNPRSLFTQYAAMQASLKEATPSPRTRRGHFPTTDDSDVGRQIDQVLDEDTVRQIKLMLQIREKFVNKH